MNINLNEFVKQLYQQANEKDLLIEIGIKHFMQYNKANKRPATCRYYDEKFKFILKYFDIMNIHYFSQISNDVLINFIEYLQTTKNGTTSINKYIGSIKTLIKYLEELELINPINIRVKKLKETQPKIQTIELETLQQIINQLRAHHSNQHQLIFELFIGTGIRRTELIYIKRCNIDFDKNSIYLERTKTGHTRYIYFDNLIKELILNEIKYKPNSEYLFVSHEGKQLSTSAIDSLFLRIKKELNILVLSPHKLRHTYATMIMQKERDIEQVRLLLGHTTYDMTKRYLHLSNEQLKETSLKSNPLNSLIRE